MFTAVQDVHNVFVEFSFCTSDVNVDYLHSEIFLINSIYCRLPTRLRHGNVMSPFQVVFYKRIYKLLKHIDKTQQYR